MYGHKAIKCKPNGIFARVGDSRMNGSGLQQGSVCYNYNKIGHIAKYYRQRIEKSIDLENNIDLEG